MLLGLAKFLGLAIPALAITAEIYARSQLDFDVKPAAMPGFRITIPAADRADPPLQVHVVERGAQDSGNRVMVIHGFGGNSECSMTLIDALAKAGHHVVAFDFPGFGRSPTDTSRARRNAEGYGRVVREVASAMFGRGTPFDLVGTSMGGGIAAAFTASHPDLVARTVLLAPAGISTPVPPTADAIQIRGVGEALIALAGRAVLAHRYSANANWSIVPEELRKPIKRAALSPVFAQGWGYFQNMLATVREFEFNGLAPRIAELGALDRGSRMLAVWGDKDRVVPVEPSASVLRESIGGITVKIIPGISHYLLWENPHLANGLVVDFLANKKA